MNCQIIYFQNRGDPEQAEQRNTLPAFEEAASTAVALEPWWSLRKESPSKALLKAFARSSRCDGL
jgi:hypothetical protein